MPNAKATLTDVEKGYHYSATTDTVGNYIFHSLPPSRYSLSVEVPGFKSYTSQNIILDVNQRLTVPVTLELGAPNQRVEVTAAPPALATQDAVTGQEVNRTFINDLPLIDRNVMDLAYLAPGVSSTGSCSGCAGNNFISNGGRNATADVIMDGTSLNNYEQNGGIQVPTYTPSPEAVQEFKVEQSNFSAEFGFTGATVVNMVTRSGTNSFHGSAYDFLRNNALDANNFFNNRDGIPLAGLQRNNFGGTVGGPIRRNKAFFFFDYDGTREHSLSTNSGGVPSEAEKSGDFGELCANNGGTFDSSGLCSQSAGQVWDPYSGVYNPDEGVPNRSAFVPFNNLATYQSPGSPDLAGTPFQPAARPGNLIDPVAAKYIQFFPAPNVGVGTANYDPFNNWATSGTTTSRNNQWDLKIDYRFNDNNTLSARYSQQNNYGHDLNCFKNEADPCTSGPSDGTAHVFAMNYNRVISPTTLLTLSYGITRGSAWDHSIVADYPNLNPVTDLGMPSYMLRSGFPQYPVIGMNNYFGIGTQGWSYLREGQETHEAVGALTHQMGRHEIKFGAEMRMHRINFTQPGEPAGEFDYSFQSTAQDPTDSSTGGDDFASFLTGFPDGGAYEVPNFVSTQNLQWGGYLQDSFRMTSKLTINFGLRYDLTLPRTERYNRMNWIDPTVKSPVVAPGLGQLYGGELFTGASQRTIYDPDFHQFQPRFGLAYAFNNKTVVRMGYGIYFSTSKTGAVGTGPIGGFQGYDEWTNMITTYNNAGAVPWGNLANPYPNGGPRFPPGSSLGLMNDVGFGASGPIRPWYTTTPQEQTWSFGLERELGWGVVASANYVGKKGTHLYYGGDGELDHLGPQVESASADQISALNSYVDNPFFGIITDPNSPLSAGSIPAYQLQLPFPQFTSFQSDDPPWANSIYHSFQTRVEKRFSNGLQFLVSYTAAKSIDDASVTGDEVSWLGRSSIQLQDPNNRKLERSISQFDIPQIFQFSYTYQIPIGRGRHFGSKLNGFADAILGGWQTNGIWTYEGGFPIGITLSGGGQALPTYGSQRPNVVGTLERNTGSDWLDNYFTNADQALVTPPINTVSNAPRVEPNVRAPGMANAGLSVFKEFSLNVLREGMHLEFRAEAANAFNHPQFSAPHSSFGSGSFGKITSQHNSPREVQLALKLYF